MKKKNYITLVVSLLTMLLCVGIYAQDGSKKVVLIKDGEVTVTQKDGNITKTIKLTKDSLYVAKTSKVMDAEVLTMKGSYWKDGLSSEVLTDIAERFGVEIEMQDGEIAIPGDEGEIYKYSPEEEKNYNQNEPVKNFTQSGNKKSNVKTRWLLLRLGINSFDKEALPRIEGGIDPTNLKTWPSLNWGLDVFQTRINVINHYVNLKTGLSFDFNFYEFENNVRLLEGGTEVAWEYDATANYSKNNLYASYMKVPLLLNFETNHKRSKSFRLNAGVYGGVRLSSRLKQKWDNKKVKIKNSYHLNDWVYGLTGSIGYGALNVYIDYSLTPFFKPEEDAGYDMNSICIGLQLIPF